MKVYEVWPGLKFNVVLSPSSSKISIYPPKLAVLIVPLIVYSVELANLISGVWFW